MRVRVPLGGLRGTTGGILERKQSMTIFILRLFNDNIVTNVCERAAL